MNVFFKGTIEAGFDVMKAQVEADMAGEAGEFCTEYRLADLGGGEVMMCACLSPLELYQYILAKGVRKHGSETIF